MKWKGTLHIRCRVFNVPHVYSPHSRKLVADSRKICMAYLCTFPRHENNTLFRSSLLKKEVVDWKSKYETEMLSYICTWAAVFLSSSSRENGKRSWVIDLTVPVGTNKRKEEGICCVDSLYGALLPVSPNLLSCYWMAAESLTSHILLPHSRKLDSRRHENTQAPPRVLWCTYLNRKFAKHRTTR